MNFVKKLRVMLGWCPNAPGEMGRSPAPSYPAAETGSDGGMLPEPWIRVDSILKEELMRSLLVYFFAFVIIGAYLMNYTNISVKWAFFIAMIPAAVHVLAMVEYRRREQIHNPAITEIAGHLLKPRSAPEDEHEEMASVPLSKTAADLLAVVVLAVLYIVLSAIFTAIRPLWIAVLIIASIAIAHILFRENEANATPVRMLIYIAIVSPLALLHDVVLGYQIIPVLVIILATGGVYLLMLPAWRLLKE
jgi:hypothetical protein